MAHFAELDQNNVVTRVIVVSNSSIFDKSTGEEKEELGVQFCKELFGDDTRWVQTSYNNKIRYNYAGEGFSYDEENDAFIPPQPYPSWVLNTTTFTWEPPVEHPSDEFTYNWDEETQEWKKLSLE